MRRFRDYKLKWNRSGVKLARRKLFTSTAVSLLLCVLLVLGCPMRSLSQTPSGSESLSGNQLRDIARQALDRIDQLQAESKAAQGYIDSLEKSEAKNEELIKALKERDQVRLDTIAALDAQIAAINQALAISEKARTDAVREEERQKKRAAKWKTLAKWGTVLGVVAGAGAVLLINR